MLTPVFGDEGSSHLLQLCLGLSVEMFPTNRSLSHPPLVALATAGCKRGLNNDPNERLPWLHTCAGYHGQLQVPPTKTNSKRAERGNIKGRDEWGGETFPGF